MYQVKMTRRQPHAKSGATRRAQVFERRLITCWTREEVNNQGSRVQIALLDFLVFSLLMMSTYTHDRL